MSASLSETKDFVNESMALCDRMMRELGPRFGGRAPMGLDSNFLTYALVQDSREMYLVMRLSVDADRERSIKTDDIKRYFEGWRWGSATWSVRTAELTGNFVLTFALPISGYDVHDVGHWMRNGFTGVMAEEEQDADLAFRLLDEVVGRA